MTNWRDGEDSVALRVGAPVPPRCDACAAEAVRTTTWAPPGRRPSVTSPEAAARLVADDLRGRDRERCVALLLDTKHRLIRQVTVSIGSIDHTFVNTNVSSGRVRWPHNVCA